MSVPESTAVSSGQSPNRDRCPECAWRIDPVSLSELHQGKRRACAQCGIGLRATVSSRLGRGTTNVLALIPIAAAWLAGVSVSSTLFLLFLLAIAWLAPPGLVAGARWVQIAADPDESGLARALRSEDS